MTAALRLRGLAIAVPSLTIGPLTLDVAAGETIAVVGASSCGKSTVLLALAGLGHDNGLRIVAGEASVPRPIGMVFSRDALEDDLGALQNVAAAAVAAGIPADEAVTVLRRLGISDVDHHRPCALLSFGQRRRVGLARALVVRPKTLLLDDPTAGLDPHTARDLLEVLADVAGDAAILLATQDIDVVLPSLSTTLLLTRHGPHTGARIAPVAALPAPFAPVAVPTDFAAPWSGVETMP